MVFSLFIYIIHFVNKMLMVFFQLIFSATKGRESSSCVLYYYN
jgi:hypothetical protein